MAIAQITSPTKPVARTDAPAPSAVPPASPAPAKAAAPKKKGKGLRVLGVIAVVLAAGAGGAGWYWWELMHALPPGFAAANGRLEAEQVEIAAKYPGRIASVLVKEGDMVDQGQVIARMDTVELEAQLRSAKAAVQHSESAAVLAKAIITQRQSELVFARQEIARTEALVPKGFAPVEQLDKRRNDLKVAEAAVDAAMSNLNVEIANIAAGQGEVARIQSQIDDSTLVAPKRGRIQYKLAQPGEVLPSGGRVVTLLDLSDVYLTVFLPAGAAGPLALGDEARVVLDPVPQYVFPAFVTFVATEAQFTPKMVETAEEREKLMFRVKLSIDPELRGKYENQAKTGIRGVGYVRTDRHAAWPDSLAVKLP
ncbi:MAG TPA: HlyD family efflux transporter periplasmic adaptor subunit [Alphaproteobacteria bacterium]|nr:HlyD family efflux transporter periplasmic adaptor subunit [Alphaproteobacteria bacterium]